MSMEVPPSEVFAIVAYDQCRAIGYDDVMLYDSRTQLLSDNQQMWRVLTDPMRPVTLIGGRTTMEPLLPVILAKGIDDVIVLSRNDHPSYALDQRVRYMRSPEEALESARHTAAVFGGAAVYQAMLPYVQRVLATEVQYRFSPANKYFPDLPQDEWVEVDRQMLDRGAHDAFEADFVTYART